MSEGTGLREKRSCHAQPRAIGEKYKKRTAEKMVKRQGIFAGNDPFEIARSWLKEAEKSEINDPNATALSTVDADGLPNVRMVLLKDITDGHFWFYTNYDSAKGREIAATGKAAMVLHWKSLRRQLRIRGTVIKEDGPAADDYYASRSLQSRLGAWASKQSQPLGSRQELMAKVAKITATKGPSPSRPPFWGGFKIEPQEIEFWADGAFRLHDRFVWRREAHENEWKIQRLNP